MEVNLENLFVAIGYTPPPQLVRPPPQLVRPLILLSQSDLFHSKNIVTVKFRTPGHELHLTIFSSMCWNQ